MRRSKCCLRLLVFEGGGYLWASGGRGERGDEAALRVTGTRNLEPGTWNLELAVEWDIG